MADSDVTKIDDSAEKAYAAASEAIAAKDPPETDADSVTEDSSAEPVEFPAKPKRARKPAVSPAEPIAVAPVVAAPVVAAPVVAAPVVAAPVVEAGPAAKPAAKPRSVKPALKRAAAKPAIAAPAKTSPIKARKTSVQKIKTARKAAPKITPKTVQTSASAAPTIPFLAKIKEIPMDVTTSIKDAVNGAQEKAKDAFTKTTATASEVTEFAKGNVEAFVESGKILASGLQEMGNKLIADSKTAFETATTDVKALTAVKSPTEFFQFQTDLLRRNFDTAVSYTTKTGEAMLKLSGDVIKPISGRVSLAVEKVKAAA
jgi:hypothetical protein